jgi:DNA adenine methylase
MHPPLKWVGGKHRLLNVALPLIQKHRDTHPRLVEPFFGGGSIFLNAGFDKALLGDSNKPLMNFYYFLKHHPDKFITDCQTLFDKETNNREAFLALRNEFNTTTDDWRKAAIYLYLNKHCFNGLMRFNKEGKFNVSFGSYKAPVCPVSALNAMAMQLGKKDVSVVCGGFETLLEQLTDEDTVVLDPPYLPINATSNFVGYSGDGFSLKQHEHYVSELKTRSNPTVIFNHDLPLTRELYQDYQFKIVGVKRTVNSKTAARGEVNEIIAYKNIRS